MSMPALRALTLPMPAFAQRSRLRKWFNQSNCGGSKII
jgi:hypothetical protein